MPPGRVKLVPSEHELGTAKRPHPLEWSSQRVRAPRAGRLLRFVQLSSERARHALRQDCSFAKQQDSPPALPVVV